MTDEVKGECNENDNRIHRYDNNNQSLFLFKEGYCILSSYHDGNGSIGGISKRDAFEWLRDNAFFKDVKKYFPDFED